MVHSFIHSFTVSGDASLLMLLLLDSIVKARWRWESWIVKRIPCLDWLFLAISDSFFHFFVQGCLFLRSGPRGDSYVKRTVGVGDSRSVRLVTSLEKGGVRSRDVTCCYRTAFTGFTLRQTAFNYYICSSSPSAVFSHHFGALSSLI